MFVTTINNTPTLLSSFSIIQVSSVHFSNANHLASAAGINEGWLNRHGSVQSHNSSIEFN
jgi:hypothetical protein